jgi:hypothetical protein
MSTQVKLTYYYAPKHFGDILTLTNFKMEWYK